MPRFRRLAGFTLIELLVVITIIGILAAIALPNYIRAKDKAKEVQTKASVRSIQVAIERYHTDFEEYPLWLLGGDVEGWNNWHVKYDEPNPPLNAGANRWVADPLIIGSYMESYPQNPFVDNGNSIISQTGMPSGPGGSYQGGDGDPRFGFQGTMMGNGLEYPMCFINWYEDETQNIETFRTLTTTTGGDVQSKGFGAPDHPRYADNGGTASSPEGLHYTMGGWLAPQEAIDQGTLTILTHWPGNFWYRGLPDRGYDRKGWTVWFPQEFSFLSVNRYMLGGYGAFNSEGTDVIRLMGSDDSGGPVHYRLPPPWNDAAGVFRASFGSGGYNAGGLPETVGGGDNTLGPWLPPDRSTTYPNDWIFGAPDGHPDGVIMVQVSGVEVQAY